MSLPNFLFNGPKKSKYTVILAHGAGAPMDSEFLNAVAVGLGKKNLRVVRFEFSYMKVRRYSGKKRPPDRLSVLNTGFKRFPEHVFNFLLSSGAVDNILDFRCIKFFSNGTATSSNC